VLSTNSVPCSQRTPVWRSGIGVRHINEVKLLRARLVLGLVTDLWRVYHPDIYPGHSGPLGLAIAHG